MRRYETIFIVRPDLGEPQIKEIIKRFEGLASSGGGEIIETEEWGFRELAYHIKVSGVASTSDSTTPPMPR